MAENKLKVSLIQATESIRKKFKKLHNERIERKQILEEQYKPITSKIGKLIVTTAAVSKQRKKPLLNSSNMSKNSENIDESIQDDIFTSANNNNISTNNEIVGEPSIQEESQQLAENHFDTINNNDNDHNDSYTMFLSGVEPKNITSNIETKPIGIKRKRTHDSIHSISGIRKQRILSHQPPKNKSLYVKLKRLEEIDALQPYLARNNLVKKEIRKRIKHTDINQNMNNKKKKRKKNDVNDMKSNLSSKGEGVVIPDIMVVDNNKTKSYVYWDNANELCGRLKLLIASQNAGHTGHQNEIVSILEELREAKIIF